MKPRIAAGMYAFDPCLQTAWKAFFTHLHQHFTELRLPAKVVFEHDEAGLLSPATRIAHICGYPLITRYKTQLRPLCVPIFDIKDNEDDGLYHSVFVVRDTDPAHTLADCRNYRAAVSDVSSNSGMNVFRAAVAKIITAQGADAERKHFFATTILSGSHLNSLASIVDNQADLASIDAITYHFAKQFLPQLCATIRTIGQSVSTMGLPFVTHVKTTGLEGETLTKAFNQNLAMMPQALIQPLKLKGFRVVDWANYQSIARLEQLAINLHYPKLQ